MLTGKNILIIGARAGGYGASIAQAASRAGAKVFGTTLIPDDQREQAFFAEIDTTLIDVPLRFDIDKRDRVFEAFSAIEDRLKAHGVSKLDSVIHTVAGGFPRQPSVMKSVGDILKGKETFFDMATAVKRNVYYVNAGSFEDTLKALPNLTDDTTRYLALTYRGELPYFISHTKKNLETIAFRAAQSGKNTIIAALPEAWTQSSQFFTGIEIAVLQNYLRHLKGKTSISEELAGSFSAMEESLNQVIEKKALTGWLKSCRSSSKRTGRESATPQTSQNSPGSFADFSLTCAMKERFQSLDDPLKSYRTLSVRLQASLSSGSLLPVVDIRPVMCVRCTTRISLARDPFRRLGRAKNRR